MVLGFRFVHKPPRHHTETSGPGVAEGWQFFSRPTELERPGTIFRIDKDRRRNIVDTLEVKTKIGELAFGQHREHVTASIGMVARIDMVARLFGIALPSIDAQAAKNERLELELKDAKLEYVSDVDLKSILDGWIEWWMERLDRRPGDRYFVIRQSISAKEITYHLGHEQVDKLGGEASLDPARIGGTVQVGTSGSRSIQQVFNQPMRVMFLPEELLLPSDLEARAPEFARRAVREPLAWSKEGRPHGTGLDFLIDDLITPLAQLLGDPWLKAVLPEVEPGMRPLLKQLVQVLTVPDAKVESTEVENAQAELMLYVGHSPAAKTKLTQIARPKVDVGRYADEDRKQLEQYMAILKFIFNRVARLQRPAALCGFLNSTNCVTVIDARTKDNRLHFPDLMIDEWSRTTPPWILMMSADSEYEAFEYNIPRVWIMRATSDERDGLAAELNKQFSLPRDYVASPGTLGSQLPTESAAELIYSIETDFIRLERDRPRIKHTSADLSLEERVAAQLKETLGTIGQERPKPDQFYIIRPQESREGVNLLLKHLEQQLKERWESKKPLM